MVSDTNLVMEVASTVMRVEEMRAQAAAHAIALANVPGARIQRFDASIAFARLQAAMVDPASLQSEAAQVGEAGADEYLRPGAEASVSPDEQVLELSSASARYQALGEGVSRQFAMMRLAVGGGRS